jgi:hypothetical protein
MDLGRKVKTGNEPEPIEAPIFDPPKRREEEPAPERELVPVRRK